jgi:endonuclease-3
MATAPAAARMPLILRRLGRVTRRPVHARRTDPLDSLIATVLSQNTTDVNSGPAFDRLKGRFPNWEAVARARPSQIAAPIRSGGLADIKAARIKRILQQIARDRGRLDLWFLDKLTLAQARDYLTSLSGVGPKTAACVLLFALGRPAFPVDTHVLRVSKRLGLIPQSTTMERAHDIYAELLQPKQMLPLHLGLVRHGREVCKAQGPRCYACSLAELCPRIGVADGKASTRKRR